MSYDLKMTCKSGFLHAEVTGIRSVDTIVDAARRIIEECSTAMTSKVLVDVRQLQGRLDTLEAYQIPAETFEDLRRPGVIKAAAIVDHPEYLDRGRFFETVAQNRGFNLRIFGDVDEAVQWIEGG